MSKKKLKVSLKGGYKPNHPEIVYINSESVKILIKELKRLEKEFKQGQITEHLVHILSRTVKNLDNKIKYEGYPALRKV